VIVGIGICKRGANSETGLDTPPRSLLSSARKAANHLISSSSLGAQSTKVRLAVIKRKVCSFSPLSFDPSAALGFSSLRPTRRDVRRVGGEALGFGLNGGASESDSEGDEEG